MILGAPSVKFAPLSRASTAVGGNQNHFLPSLSSEDGLGVHMSPLLATVAPHSSRHFWGWAASPRLIADFRLVL